MIDELSRRAGPVAVDGVEFELPEGVYHWRAESHGAYTQLMEAKGAKNNVKVVSPDSSGDDGVMRPHLRSYGRKIKAAIPPDPVTGTDRLNVAKAPVDDPPENLSPPPAAGKIIGEGTLTGPDRLTLSMRHSVTAFNVPHSNFWKPPAPRSGGCVPAEFCFYTEDGTMELNGKDVLNPKSDADFDDGMFCITKER